MLFEAFQRNRIERAHEPAFLIAAGDQAIPITWKRFTDDIALVAHLIDKHAQGAKIGILGENSYPWVVGHAACLFAGAVAVPLDPNLSADEIVKRLKFVGATYFVYSSLYAEKAKEVAVQMPQLVVGNFGSRLTDKFLRIAMRGLELLHQTIWDRKHIDVDSLATLVFTSGTTSEPRAVELTIRAIETFTRSTEHAVPMTPGQRSLLLLPLHHIYGICVTYAMLAQCVALGVCPDFRRIYDAFERFGANFAFLVPALAEILATKIERRGKTAEEALGQPIDWIMTGGAPLSQATYRRLTELGIPTLGAYGLTETCACYAMSRLGDTPRPCTAGRVSLLPEVETKVSDEGELLVRGPHVMKGYYQMPERTAAAIDADGWFHTGDLGRIDADGYVWITGRKSRTIILSSGKKVAPEELEDKLLSLPGVSEALVSNEATKGEHHIQAEIYAHQAEADVRRAVTLLNRTLPTYQRIKTVVFRTEPFPRTASGKIKVG